MLKKLNLRNFRAFKAQTFNLAKVNVFVGPNNSGKSSAISAVNLLAQTVASAELEENPIVINGPFDTLGTYLDVVHGNRSNSPLGIDFSFDNYEVRLEYKYRQQRREIELVKYELYDGRRQVLGYSTRKDSFSLRVMGEEVERAVPGFRKRRPAFRNLMPLTRFVPPYVVQRTDTELTSEAREKLSRAERSMFRSRMQLRDLFENFDSLSPFREKPQRTYLYSGETAQRIGVTGGNTAVILSSDAARRGGEPRHGRGDFALVSDFRHRRRSSYPQPYATPF